MSRVVHFEINAETPERAAKFYTDVFGWKIEKWAGPVDYWLVSTGDESESGINGAIKDRTGTLNTVNTIGTASIDNALQAVTQAGGKVLTEKMAIPGIGYHAYCQDNEGNVFGIMQEDLSAK